MKAINKQKYIKIMVLYCSGDKNQLFDLAA